MATGLRTSEARLLMVLEHDSSFGMAELQRQVAMPAREIEEAVAILTGKGLVREEGGHYGLTAAGIEHAEMLARIAEEQQQRMFAASARRRSTPSRTCSRACSAGIEASLAVLSR
ncbi:hypothetical protein E6B08_17815 [Pseudomonas putida]|uniref:Uncharacterized protein n=1 Tax=Pseudomonas putida TaxID=303 RepID=A0A4D6XBD3_PSEPU|nr:hypothetical protein [Pseudomonas putida]QCI13114.1 hypothetical protein E6B08_17815 [Pseudomonas putida]